MKTISEELKNQIKMYIKNNQDISELIKGYNIKGLNLANAIISDIDRQDEDISNTSFYNAIIGCDGKITNLSGCNFMGCNFTGARFLGKVWLRRCNCQNAKFNNAFMPGIEYQGADFRNVDACSAIFPFGSADGLHCKFSKSVLDKLTQYWDIT